MRHTKMYTASIWEKFNCNMEFRDFVQLQYFVLMETKSFLQAKLCPLLFKLMILICYVTEEYNYLEKKNFCLKGNRELSSQTSQSQHFLHRQASPLIMYRVISLPWRIVNTLINQ